jgi:hypothetical protein
MIYKNLEQRVAQSYIDLFPMFVADEDAPVSMAEQKLFHELMRNLYRLAFDEPQLFVAALHEDDAYPNRYKKGYGKPKLIEDMRSFLKTVNALVQKMFLMGQGDKVKLSRREQVVLARLGLGDCGNLPAALCWMATREGASLIAFAYCLFKQGYSYGLGIYARLFGEEAFGKLTAWMFEHGYKAFDIYDVTASDCKLSLAIANPKWGEETPRGGYEYKIKHTGVAALYDYYVQQPLVLGLCIPNGLKPYLEVFHKMDKALQRFIIHRTKKCDGCRYCVQTDKTGARPLACMPIHFEGKDYPLCPFFPGYHYCWEQVDDGLVEELIRMLDFMDTLAPEKGR